MSEEPTQDIKQKYDTKPTIETVLERINALSSELHGEIRTVREYLDQQFGALRQQLEELESRLDRVEGTAYRTHGEFVEMRRDFKEFKAQFKEPA